MKNIGELLCEIRKDKKMTLQDVANILNCSISFISHLENNRRSIDVSNIIN